MTDIYSMTVEVGLFTKLIMVGSVKKLTPIDR